MVSEFDEERHFLGRLCTQNHEWENTGQSLRYKSARKCVICCRNKPKNKQRSKKEYAERRAERSAIRKHQEELERFHGVDTNKFELDILCPSGHDFNDTGYSLRYLTGNKSCAECRKAKSRAYSKQLYADSKARRAELKQNLLELAEQSGIDTEKFKIGVLCSRQHRWNGADYSLRWNNKSSTCIECDRLQHRNWRKLNLERARELDKQFRLRHPGYARKYFNPEKNRITCRLRYYANKAEYNARNRANYRKNWAKLRSAANAYSKTPQGRLVKSRSQAKRRALKKQTRLVPYKTKDLKAHYQLFHNCCAYCGKAESITIDHLIPLSKGGPDCLGNIVPCCLACNVSKQDFDALEWFKSQPFFDQDKWLQILRILGKDNPDQIPLF